MLTAYMTGGGRGGRGKGGGGKGGGGGGGEESEGAKQVEKMVVGQGRRRGWQKKELIRGNRIL